MSSSEGQNMGSFFSACSIMRAGDRGLPAEGEAMRGRPKIRGLVCDEEGLDRDEEGGLACVGRAAAEEGEAEPAPGVALDVLRELPLSDCRPLVSNGCS
mmetsp:Transcript_25485/g.65588  ORF Transcript_25485/g.65588 Transcript_25485/m.65588 type:complete len:99 (+) Transcript_25485:1045-1341(+)